MQNEPNDPIEPGRVGSAGPPPLPLPLPPIIARLERRELEDLAQAKALLENPGLTARIAAKLGRPIESGLQMLPAGWQGAVNTATRTALTKALDIALSSLGRQNAPASESWHKMLVGASGGIGGVFGLAALPVELPVSTTIMLRSIADIARSEGHDLNRPDIRLACLEVFALGGRSRSDDAAESSYWAVRAGLAKAITEAATLIAQRGAIEKSSPALLRFIAAVASRFGIVVSEEVAAKAVPVIGAAGGAIVNVLFIDHFQDMARGHFIVKRLEDKYGYERIRSIYDTLAVPFAGKRSVTA